MRWWLARRCVLARSPTARARRPRPRSDASPILVELRDTRPGLLRFLVRVCAVVGGAFAVTGLFDKIIHGLIKGAGKAIHPGVHMH